MGKNLLNSLGAKLSQLKVMCGLSVDSAAKEEQAVAAVRRDPIPAASFVAVYRHRHLDQRLGTEFKAVSKNQEDHPTAAAMRNVLNNVKQDIVPYDHSRVKLTYCPLPDTTNDYINASYIDGYSLLREYIATQGPSGKTVAAFWHMVWQEGIRCIVMATGLFDNAVQCDKYWNDMASSHRYVRHGDIHIWNEDSVFMARLNIRTFRIQREGGFEQRLVRQYEMVGFREENPDPGLLLDVRRRVNSFTQHAPGPILVHCRCGGGRSAVFLAVDYCLKQLEMEDVVDVYSAVLHLRRFRKNMIRTVSQYGQVYAAVAMHLQCGETVYPVSLLPTAYTSYYSRQVDPSHSKLEKEYQQMLKVIVPRLSIGDCASGHRVENRNKSRDIMMLPPERARPYLMTTEQGENATDFINAVYVDGYHQENTFLVTQWPKKHTINDLWRLLFDFKITSLVVLNEVKFSRTYPRFWPKELDCEVRYGPISVRYLGCGKYPNVIVRAFAIHKCPKFDYHVPGYLFKVSRRAMMLTNIPGCEIREDDLVVKMFQVCGGGTRKPSKGRVALPPKSLLATLEAAEGWQQKNNPLNPICVLSKDGASRCGIFCAVHMCCDQVKNDGEVDVFNAVRLVRHNRPQLVTTVDEYRYIYSFMTDYIRSTVSQRPQIVITGAEGDNLANRNASKQPADGLSTDDSLSCISSQAGSFETALDEVMDSMLPDSAEVQSRLTACNSQLSPHLSGRIHLGADGCSFPSTDSLSSGPGPHPHEALSSVGFMAASIANAFAPDTVSHNTVLSNNVNHHHKNCAHSKDRVLEQNWHANHVSHMSDRSPLIGGVCVRDRNAAVVGNHIACRASVPECVCERAEKPEKKLERRNTNDSFHSVGSSLHLWQT